MSGENVTTVAESSLWVSVALPVSQTAASFALLTWVKIGEVTNMGSVLGRAYNNSTHAPVDTAQQIQKKASYTLGESEFMMGWDENDAGQIIVDDASRGYDILAFKLEKQDGALRYLTAQVSKFVENNGSVDDIVQGALTLLRQTDTIKVPAP